MATVLMIIEKALPYASALVKFLSLAVKAGNSSVSKEDIEQEIAAIRSWVEDAEMQEADIFARASSDDG